MAIATGSIPTLIGISTVLISRAAAPNPTQITYPDNNGSSTATPRRCSAESLVRLRDCPAGHYPLDRLAGDLRDVVMVAVVMQPGDALYHESRSDSAPTSATDVRPRETVKADSSAARAISDRRLRYHALRILRELPDPDGWVSLWPLAGMARSAMARWCGCPLGDSPAVVQVR
jgi:hypothetical protein